MNVDAVAKNLKQKYANPTLSNSNRQQHVYVWIYAKGGRLLATADSELQQQCLTATQGAISMPAMNYMSAPEVNDLDQCAIVILADVTTYPRSNMIQGVKLFLVDVAQSMLIAKKLRAERGNAIGSVENAR